MKKTTPILLLLIFIMQAGKALTPAAGNEEQINNLLDNWHKAAGKADFNAYFNAMAEDAVFLGTDATEYWDKKQFMAYSKPYFDAGKAWNFTSLERHIYFDSTGDIAWFDELLNTQMKICRGSGVVVKQNGEWKIKQYVLSMTIPNDNSDDIIRIKTPLEDAVIDKLKKKF